MWLPVREIVLREAAKDAKIKGQREQALSVGIPIVPQFFLSSLTCHVASSKRNCFTRSREGREDKRTDGEQALLVDIRVVLQFFLSSRLRVTEVFILSIRIHSCLRKPLTCHVVSSKRNCFTRSREGRENKRTDGKQALSVGIPIVPRFFLSSLTCHVASSKRNCFTRSREDAKIEGQMESKLCLSVSLSCLSFFFLR